MNTLTPGPSTNRFESNHQIRIQNDEPTSSSFYKYNSKPTDQQIANLYEMDQTIGQGHFAVVKLARHKFSNEKVAIKVIDKTKLDKLSREHLFQEVKCMKLVQHPNVVRLYEVIDTPTKLYLILELGDGGDMYDYIMKHSNGLSENKARNYFRQIVRAVKYCHDLHVVHRDLKPENVVFFEQNGQVKLTDFGFSNVFIPGDKLLTSCGSLAYSAPEILLGDSYDAPPVDIWSLGVILYMLVSGRAPFQEANDSETLTMILDCKYYIPSYLSAECQELISRMLVRNPEKRIKLDEIANHEWLKKINSLSGSSGDDNTSVDQLNIDDDDDLNRNNSKDNDRISRPNKKLTNNSDSANEDFYLVPLIKREHLSQKDNDDIVDAMVNGNIATKEEIIEALDQDKYNYITATFYLLAERLLKKEYFARKKLKISSNKKNNSNVNKLKSTPVNNISTEGNHNHTNNGNSNVKTKRKLSNQHHQQKNGDLGKIKRNILVKQEEEDEADESEFDSNDQVAPTTNHQKLFKKSSLDDNNSETLIIKKTLTPIIAVEEDETEEDEANNETLKLNSKEKDAQQLQVPLTNIIEDEEDTSRQEENDDGIETIEIDSNQSAALPTVQTLASQQPQNSQIRRCSRGGIIDNPLTSLTILEEVESDLLANNSVNSNHKNFNNSISTEPTTSPILVSQVSNETTEENNLDPSNKYFYTIDSNKNKSDYESDQDHLSRNAIRLSNKSKNYSIQTRTDSSSDNSDNELKKLTKKMLIDPTAANNTTNNNCIISINNNAIDDNNYDWSRSASASSRSRNKYRSHSNNLLSKNEIRHRPLSISSETSGGKDDHDPITQYRLAPRTKSLAETSNTIAPNNKITTSKQQSISNSNDHLNSINSNNKTLSIEHRMANMSQMSISSQLSKNNSVRFFNTNNQVTATNNNNNNNNPVINRNGSCDTPNFHHNNSATPTPRESIVFNRGDDRPPIAKILLSNKISNDLIIKESNEITSKLIELSNSYNNDNKNQDDEEEINENKREELNKNDDSENDQDESESTVTTITIQNTISSKSNTNNLIKQKLDSFNNLNEETNKSNSNIRQHNPSYSSAINNEMNKGENVSLKREDSKNDSIKKTNNNNNGDLTQKNIERILKKSNSTSSTSNLLTNSNQKLNQVSHKEFLKPINVNNNINTNDHETNKQIYESSTTNIKSVNNTKQYVSSKKDLVTGGNAPSNSSPTSSLSSSKKNCMTCHQCCIII